MCSGLDGTCYSNDTIIDVGIKCKSLNNVCYTIYLTVRVNPTSTIDLILGRVTLNKYSSYELTHFAFGINEEDKVKSTTSDDCTQCRELPYNEPLLSQRFLSFMTSDKNKNSENHISEINIEDPSVKTTFIHKEPKGFQVTYYRRGKLNVCGQLFCSSELGFCPALMKVSTPITGCDRGRAIHGGLVHPELTCDGDTPPENVLIHIPPTPEFLNDEEHDTLRHSPSVVITSNCSPRRVVNRGKGR